MNSVTNLRNVDEKPAPALREGEAPDGRFGVGELPLIGALGFTHCRKWRQTEVADSQFGRRRHFETVDSSG